MSLGKKYYLISSMILMVLLFSGCASELPEMEPEEQDQIVEYAVHLLLKYDKNYNYRLLDAEVLEEEEAKNADKKEVPEGTAAPAQDAPEEPAVIDNVEVEEEKPQISLTEFYGLEGLQVRYSGFQVLQYYPDDSEDMYFMVNAGNNKDLLVLEFEVTNQSGAEYILDMPGQEAEFRVGINDGKARRAMFTMLLNDFSTYQGTLQDGESVTLAIICEVTEEETQDIMTLSLYAANKEDSAQVIL